MPLVHCLNCSAPTQVADGLATDARVRCEQCGKRFTITDSTLAGEEPLELDDCEETPTSRRSRVILLAACGGLVLLVASVAVGWLVSRTAKRDDAPTATAPAADPKHEPNPPLASQPRKPAGDGEKLASSTLFNHYQANRERAAAQYDGANLTVTGKLVGPTERPASGEIVIELSGGTEGASVWCRMDLKVDNDADHLPTGTEVTIRGRCAGIGATVGQFGPRIIASGDVVLTDCVLVGKPIIPPPPTIPTPAGTDHPSGIEHHGIHVRVTAVQVGRPVMVLGGAGPNAGATARTRDKYLIFKMEVRNRHFGPMYNYAHPGGDEVWLRDERGARFDYERFEVPAAARTVVANELAATPKRRWRFEGETAEGPLAERQTATYYLIFDSKHLGEGKRFFLTLPPGVFGLRVVDQVLRFDQSVVESLPESASPDLTPATAMTIEAATIVANAVEVAALDAEVSALVTQLSKGKTPADRVRAAEDMRRIGRKAKGATASLCNALFDSSPQVRLAALDALKAVNPQVYGPVATLVAPLTEADFLFMGSSGRPEAVAALAKLGAEGRAAVPVLIRYKAAISKPGGWPQVPAVIDALAVLAPDDTAVVALLVQALTKDEYAAARLSAAKGLAKTKPTKESVAALASVVRSDPVAEVRLAAVNTLAKFGAEAKAALKALEGAKADPDARVREAARDAIDKIK